MALQAEVTQARVIIRTPAKRPKEFPVDFFDWKIVDTGEASHHQPLLVELPVFVAVRAKPVSRVVVKFVSEADGEAVAVGRPKFLDQSVILFARPFPGQEIDDKVAPPDRVVRYDGDDPYLVVAADKGTATFSDIANGVAAEHGHWLGDAFASGGSVGYDHKGMGITARGAWEAVKRHFREMGKDIQKEPFTVVGIGDMSGDVFGNGMLLSKHIRLKAAFNHLHIFLDPDPDMAASFNHMAERLAITRQEVREQYELYDHYQPRLKVVIPPGVDLSRFSPPTESGRYLADARCRAWGFVDVVGTR